MNNIRATLTLAELQRAAGRWIVLQALERQRQAGTYAAASEMRRQGVPLAVAVNMLGRRSP